jgi:quinol monooxygenase YgiN
MEKPSIGIGGRLRNEIKKVRYLWYILVLVILCNFLFRLQEDKGIEIMKKISRREMMVGSTAAVAVAGLVVSEAVGCDDVPARKKLPEGAVILTAQITAKEGFEKELEEACRELVESTVKEDGCISYIFHVNVKKPGEFMFYEQWTNREALNAHMKTDHMARYQEKSRGKTGKGSASFWKID